jgi:hypothetical protein
LTVDRAVRANLQDGWRGNKMKTRKVWLAIRDILGNLQPTGRAHLIERSAWRIQALQKVL